MKFIFDEAGVKSTKDNGSFGVVAGFFLTEEKESILQKRAIEISVFFSSFLCVFYSINKYGNRSRDLCILLSIPTVSYWKSSFTLSPSGNKSPPACH